VVAGGGHWALSVADVEGERKAIEGHWHGVEKGCWGRVGV
jgi:hypothetical protein